MRAQRLLAFTVALAAAVTGCRTSASPAPHSSPAGAPTAAVAASPAAPPSPALPAYYIEELRARGYLGGPLQVEDAFARGDGFTRFHVSWPSGGQPMTGTMSVPDGAGPFPVVIVNHGFIPAGRYWVGQDSWIFGDPLAAHGFIAVSPNWPGYAGSGPEPSDLPTLVGEMVATLDLVSSLAAYSKADVSRLALIGHSNGGGISLLAMVVDPRVKAVVLFAPVSSDMADNARKWWDAGGSAGAAGAPDANPEGYRHLSPRNYFAAGQAPALFLQGTADEEIPAAWTQASHDAIAAQGVKTGITWFPGARHDLVAADLARANQLSEQWIRAALDM